MKNLTKVIIVYILLVMGNSVKAEGKYKTVEEALSNLKTNKMVYVYTNDSSEVKGRILQNQNGTLYLHKNFEQSSVLLSDIRTIKIKKSYAGTLGGIGFVGGFLYGVTVATAIEKGFNEFGIRSKGNSYATIKTGLLCGCIGLGAGVLLGGIINVDEILYEDSGNNEDKKLSFNLKPDVKGGAVFSATVSF